MFEGAERFGVAISKPHRNKRSNFPGAVASALAQKLKLSVANCEAIQRAEHVPRARCQPTTRSEEGRTKRLR